jgi:hypothetical protein
VPADTEQKMTAWLSVSPANYFGQRRGFLASHAGKADRIDDPSFAYRSFPQTAAARYHCTDFLISFV